VKTEERKSGVVIPRGLTATHAEDDSTHYQTRERLKMVEFGWRTCREGQKAASNLLPGGKKKEQQPLHRDGRGGENGQKEETLRSV